MTDRTAAQTSGPRTAAERDLCDVLYHSEFHISREQANISGRLMYDAMLARGYRIEAEAAAPASPDVVEALRRLLSVWDTRNSIDPGIVRSRGAVIRQARAALSASEAAALRPLNSEAVEGLPAVPAGLPSGERLYRVFWAVKWEGGAYPNQWEQLTPRQQETWDQIAAAYAEGEPE